MQKNSFSFNEIIGEIKMTNGRNKTTAISVALILMLATSAALLTIPNVSAKTTLTVSPRFINQIGENTETVIVFIINPNILNSDPGAGDPNLVGQPTIWPDAVVTLTRPDGTTDVVNGPLINRPNVIGEKTDDYTSTTRLICREHGLSTFTGLETLRTTLST
jgi:hypothetical protein